MEDFKCLVKVSMKLLIEADEYADMFAEHKDDMNMKNLYYTLSSGHLDMYAKVRGVINNYVTSLVSEYPDEHADSIWNFVKQTETDLYNKVKEKLS